MTGDALEFLADYDFGRAIVWDALVDEVLVAGWLASASIDPRAGGQYVLEWLTGTGLAPAIGVITEFVPKRRLVIETNNIGTLCFTLAPSGVRGNATSLALSIDVDTEPRLLATTRAYWRSNLEQLAELLRGRPVDWANWAQDRGATWARYRDEVARPLI